MGARAMPRRAKACTGRPRQNRGQCPSLEESVNGLSPLDIEGNKAVNNPSSPTGGSTRASLGCPPGNWSPCTWHRLADGKIELRRHGDGCIDFQRQIVESVPAFSRTRISREELTESFSKLDTVKRNLVLRSEEPAYRLQFKGERKKYHDALRNIVSRLE